MFFFKELLVGFNFLENKNILALKKTQEIAYPCKDYDIPNLGTTDRGYQSRDDSGCGTRKGPERKI